MSFSLFSGVLVLNSLYVVRVIICLTIWHQQLLGSSFHPFKIIQICHLPSLQTVLPKVLSAKAACQTNRISESGGEGEKAKARQVNSPPLLGCENVGILGCPWKLVTS